MLKRVVVGIDGAPASKPILEWCRRAFSATETEVVLVACGPIRSKLGDAANEALRAELRRGLDKACAELGADGLRCRGLVVDGDARVGLVEAAKAEGAELIIVGSRGRSQLHSIMLGSVASHLTHHSPLPVVVVR